MTIAQPPAFLYAEWNNELPSPEVAVVVPVYNQADIIGQNLESIAEFADRVWEIILVDDASTDASLERMTETLSTIMIKTKNLARARIFKATKPIFETRCDAFAIEQSTAPIIIEIQADMRIGEPGFMSKFSDALNASSDLLMLSGRGVHTLGDVIPGYLRSNGSDRKPKSFFGLFEWLKAVVIGPAMFFGLKHPPGRALQIAPSANQTDHVPKDESSPLAEIFPTDDSFVRSGRAGRLGDYINLEVTPEGPEGMKIWVGETVMRGPLAIHRLRYDEVGALDTTRFFQGFDDHDLALRGLLHGYRVGFLPICFSSPLEWGTTRKRRTLTADLTIRKEVRRIRSLWKDSALANYDKLDVPRPLPEIRNL